MSELFYDRAARPMLVGAQAEPFDNADYIFELKLDGERCLAYLDKNTVELRNKRERRLAPRFPELASVGRQVKKRCILDGELTVLENGSPSFALVQRRAITERSFSVALAAKAHPAVFTAFDMLYLDGRDLTGLPLETRKELLAKNVRENEFLALSRPILEEGKALFAAARARGLEGVVAKHRGSFYVCGRRTNQWIKIKNLLDDDFAVAGYVPGEGASNSLVLAQYRNGVPVYKGRVTLGARTPEFETLAKKGTGPCPFAQVPPGCAGAVWLRPGPVCRVRFMERGAKGGLRQPIFDSLRGDKLPRECVEPPAAHGQAPPVH